MKALDAPIKAVQAAIDDLKTEMYAGMGAYEQGKKGNQLLDDDKWSGYTPEEEDKATPNKGDMSPTGNADKPGLHLTNSKPQFAMGDTPAYVTGLDDDASVFSKPQESETERLQRLMEGIRQANQDGTIDEYLKENGLNKSDMIALPKQLEDVMGLLAYQDYVKGLDDDASEQKDSDNETPSLLPWMSSAMKENDSINSGNGDADFVGDQRDDQKNEGHTYVSQEDYTTQIEDFQIQYDYLSEQAQISYAMGQNMWGNPTAHHYQDEYIESLEKAYSIKEQMDTLNKNRSWSAKCDKNWRDILHVKNELLETDYKELPQKEWDKYLKNLKNFQGQLEDYENSGYFEGIDGAGEKLKTVQNEVSDMIINMVQVDWSSETPYSAYLVDKLEGIGPNASEAAMEAVINYAGDLYPAGTAMLDVAMHGNGDEHTFDVDDIVGETVATDPYFNNLIKEKFESGDWRDQNIDVAFAGENDDLHFGIGKATAHIDNVEQRNGIWYLSVSIEDTYNYDEWMIPEQHSMPSINDFINPMPYIKDVGIPALNNTALAAQYYGSLTPYELRINVTLEIPAE